MGKVPWGLPSLARIFVTLQRGWGCLQTIALFVRLRRGGGRGACGTGGRASITGTGPECAFRTWRPQRSNHPHCVTTNILGLGERQCRRQLQIDHQLDAPVQLVEQRRILGGQDLAESRNVL